MAKRQHVLLAREFAKDSIALTDDDLLQYGARIVSGIVGTAMLNKRHHLELSRNYLVNRCSYGKLKPMGKHRGKYYYYRSDIDLIHPFPHAHRRPPVTATDREEVPAADRRELVVA